MGGRWGEILVDEWSENCKDRLNQAKMRCCQYRLQTGLDPKFFDDTCDMIARGHPANAECSRDFDSSHALRQQLQHLVLARREVLQRQGRGVVDVRSLRKPYGQAQNAARMVKGVGGAVLLALSVIGHIPEDMDDAGGTIELARVKGAHFQP